MNKVELVAMTKPMIEGVDTAEQFIAYCARVSNPSNQLNNDTAEKLLQYCIRNKHWSIFETVHVTMSIETTRDIARQILRHRSFSYQEFSQRYAEVTEMSVPREARWQDTKNRQNSIEIFNDETGITDTWHDMQKALIEHAQENYEWAINNGIAKEVARSVLPEGLTMSRMYMSGSLRSWITYIALREKSGTQKEHKLIALECKKIICEQFPSVAAALGGAEREWTI
jgi:thymidylate synthase (FAD)